MVYFECASGAWLKAIQSEQLMPDLERFCTLCGKDVAREKCIRDREGDLYCATCHETKQKVLARQREQGDARTAASAALPAAQVVVPVAHAPMPWPIPQPDAEV